MILLDIVQLHSNADCSCDIMHLFNKSPDKWSSFKHLSEHMTAETFYLKLKHLSGHMMMPKTTNKSNVKCHRNVHPITNCSIIENKNNAINMIRFGLNDIQKHKNKMKGQNPMLKPHRTTKILHSLKSIETTKTKRNTIFAAKITENEQKHRHLRTNRFSTEVYVSLRFDQ